MSSKDFGRIGAFLDDFLDAVKTVCDLPANSEGQGQSKKDKKVARRGGQDEKINSVYRERADVDGGKSGRI